MGRGRYFSVNFDSDSGLTRSRHIFMEKEQKFPVKGALIQTALLLFSCMSFALPTIFNAFPSDDSKSVLLVSRIGAWIVGSSYVAFLLFQLLTHANTLKQEERRLGRPPFEAVGRENSTTGSAGPDEAEDDDDDESASLTSCCAVGLMCVTTLVIAINSELLVDTIQIVVQRGGIPQNFIGVILLPIAGNACEHAAAIRFAMQDRPGLAIGIAVGSSTQVALLVVPFAVVAGWVLGEDLNLDFGCLNTAVVTFSVLVVLTLLLDGLSNWLKGYLLVALYVFISVLYWFVPVGEGSPLQSTHPMTRLEV